MSGGYDRSVQPVEPGNELMPDRLVMHLRLMLLAVGLSSAACGSALTAQGGRPAGRNAGALAAVAQVMALRRDALGDPLQFDACTVFEKTGRPSGFPAGLPPGLVPLLDRTGPDPCATAQPDSAARFPRIVRVDSVAVTGSGASVHLSIKRGEWSYNEDYFFAALPEGRGWGFREARITHPFRITPPPPR
jgi:hypothetical protein